MNRRRTERDDFGHELDVVAIYRSPFEVAHLCGVAPLPASSGKQTHHRLNQGGDRQANAALYRIAIVRLRHEQRTQNYVARRQREDKTKRDAIRCVKRYIAREVYKTLHDNAHLTPV